MKICPACKTENRDDAKFCIGCRRSFSSPFPQPDEARGGTRPMTIPEPKGEGRARGTVPELEVELPPVPEGTEIGNWRIERSLGKGGMARVYLARHMKLGHTAALKALSPTLTRDPGFHARFQREASTQAVLQHPHIARVYDYVEQDGGFYIVIEHLSGGTLLDVIKERNAPLALDAALQFASEALAGLAYAHRQQVIHRDITSSNVMLDHFGVAKITDFGIALIAGSKRMTLQGKALGTPHYMSPEQIRHPQDVDLRTDIYSMGVVLYEMLTGRVPFEADTDFEVQRAQVADPPPAPRSINPEIPLALEKIVLKALEKDPNERYASCEEFSKAIQDFRALPRPVVIEPKKDEPKPKEPKAKPARRDYPWWKEVGSILATVVVLFGAAYYFKLFDPKPSEPVVSGPEVKLVRALTGHKNSVLSLAFTDVGEMLVSTSSDYSVRVWDPATAGSTKASLPAYVNDLALMPNGSDAALATADGTITIWSLTAMDAIRSWKAHDGAVGSIAVTPNGKIILSAAELDSTIKQWSADSGKLISENSDHKQWVTSLAVSRDGRTYASGGLDGLSVSPLMLGGGWTALSDKNTQSVAFSPDGKILVSGFDDGTIQIWSTDTWTSLRTLNSHTNSVKSIAVDKAGKYLVSGGKDGVKLWSLDSYQVLKAFSSDDDVSAVAFSPAGDKFAVGEISKEPVIMLWQIVP